MRILRTGLVVSAVMAGAAGVSALPDAARAQCTARTQTGSGQSAVIIAQRCGTTVQALRRANPGIGFDNATGGRRLAIPGGRTSAMPDTLRNNLPPASPRLEPMRDDDPAPRVRLLRHAPETEPGARYEVRRGDTMGAIAARAGISLDALMRANPDVVPQRMSVGSHLVIPQG